MVSEDRKVSSVSMTSAHGSFLGKNSRLISLRLSQALLIPNTNFFYKSNGVTRRFPLYWQEEVQRFKSQEDQMKNLIVAINEKNILVTKKIEIINSFRQKVANHEKMVFSKVFENEKLVKAI
ncbi:hypothetical protein HKD37_12G033708 [Glycine soja]